MIELAPYECARVLPDGTVERTWFYGFEAVLLWIHQRLDVDAAIAFNGQPVDRAHLVAAVERFDPLAARLDERDALNFLDGA